MSLSIELEQGRARLVGAAPPREARSRPGPANDGHGDVRKKIVPVVKARSTPSATEWEGGAYVSIAEWLQSNAKEAAILVQPHEDVSALEGRVNEAALIGVDFHRIGDGRGYSHAFVLRNRLNYRGRLRALGAVTADQLGALALLGFDSFALREDQIGAAALASLSRFTQRYQGALVAGDERAREEANSLARTARLERALTEIAGGYERPALASSLSAEDMVITDAIARLGLPIDVLTLDTGRLHRETLALIDDVRTRYGIEIEVVRPEPEAVAAYIAAHGRDGFYQSVAQRKLCCQIRKVLPLQRALAGRGAWITGQRREQATTRGGLQEREVDEDRGLAKFNPLATWTWADVLAYVDEHNAPMNALYQRGYVSIGCEPCTKAIQPGQDPREGRWWWEARDAKECGLHVPAARTTEAATL